MKHLVCVLLVVLSAAIASSQTPQTPPPLEKQQPPSNKPLPPATKAQPRPPSGGVGLAVQVTDKSGNGIGDVSVRVGGPVDRSGSTAQDGTIAFRSMRPGTYRLRFEHEQFTTLEREMTIAARSAEVSVALTPAPPPPKPVAPVPQPTAAPPARAGRTVEPHVMSIADYLDRELIKSEPVKTSMLGCAEGGTAVLLQIREPLTERQHPDADEILYVVAGAGVLRIRNQETKMNPGHFALVPRGVPHSLRRDGRNPMIAVSVLAGAPCTESTPPVK